MSRYEPIVVSLRHVAIGAETVPVIVTPRLTLRPMAGTDVDAFIDAAPGSHQPGLLAAAPGRQELELMRAMFAEEWAAHGLGYFLVFENPEPMPIGHVRLKSIPRSSGEEKTVEVIYGIDAPFQGRGFAKEAVAGALFFAFEVAGVMLAMACVEPDHLASLAVALDHGFRGVAIGVVHGIRMHRLFLKREDWRQQPSAMRA